MQTYLVGGAVRDHLLGIAPRERDWVVLGASPEDMIAAGYKPVGRDFPVFLHPGTGEEYALARTERKTAPGYHGFTFHTGPDVTLEDDLRRRDLTINAMAEAPNGEIIDPYNGRADLNDGLLKHVSPAFAEDPVRILRVARFAARFGKWGFKVAHGTHALMKAMVERGEADALVPERVWAETVKALGEDTPERYFRVLRRCGALARVYPELDALFGVEQPPAHHPEIDTGEHALMVLAQAARLSPDPRVRFAALVHDLGKGSTPKDRLPAHHGHEQRGVGLVEQLCARVKAPNDYRRLAVAVARHHGNIHRARELRPATLHDLLSDLGALRNPQFLDDVLLACEADARGRTGHEGDAYPQAGYLRQAAATINSVQAADIAGEGLQGPAIGRRLREARIAALQALRPTPGPPDGSRTEPDPGR